MEDKFSNIIIKDSISPKKITKFNNFLAKIM